MTIRNVPITIGFLAITVSQLVLGIWMTVLGSRSGGKVSGGLGSRGSFSFKAPALLLRRQTAPVDTPRCIQLVCV